MELKGVLIDKSNSLVTVKLFGYSLKLKPFPMIVSWVFSLVGAT